MYIFTSIYSYFSEVDAYIYLSYLLLTKINLLINALIIKLYEKILIYSKSKVQLPLA